MARAESYSAILHALFLAFLLSAVVAQQAAPRLDGSRPGSVTEDFTARWKAIADAPGLDAAQRQRSRDALIADLLPRVGSLDSATRAEIAEVVRATPLAEEAARGFVDRAREVSQRLLSALGARMELPEGRIRSIRLLEDSETGVISGVVVTLDDGRERAVPTEKEVDGVRLDLLDGATFEPVGLLHVDGKLVRCFPRAGLIVAPWPEGKRKTWLEAFFGPEGSVGFQRAEQHAHDCLKASKGNPWYARARAQYADLDDDGTWTDEEIAGMDPGVPPPPNATEDDLMWSTFVPHPDAAWLCAWVGGRSFLAPNVEIAERAWLSLAWVARMPAGQRTDGLAWVHEEFDPLLKTFHLHPAGKGADPQPLPDLEAEIAALALREAELTWTSLSIDAGAGVADKLAVLRTLEPKFEQLGQRSETLRKLEKSPPAPAGLAPELQKLLYGWLRRDPDPANTSDGLLARDLEPAARLLATIGAGEPLDFSSEPADYWGHPSTMSRWVDDLFELVSFRFTWLAARDLSTALAEFTAVWPSVERIYHPSNVHTLERRDTARRALLRALMLQRARLDATQRANCRELIAATDAWTESAEGFDGEAAAVCETIRRKIAEAAQKPDISPDAFAAKVHTIDTFDRDGSAAGLVLGLQDGQRVQLAPGDAAQGIRLREISDSILDPIAHLDQDGDRLLLFPWSGFCLRDWPDLPRGGWLRARFGEGSSRWKLMVQLARGDGTALKPRLPPALWAKIEKALVDPDVDPALSAAELDQILEQLRSDGLINAQNLIGAWLAPQVIVAGEVDCEERFWRNLARICRITEAAPRKEGLDSLPARFDAERKPWMDPTPMTKLCLEALLTRVQIHEGVLDALSR